MCPVIDNPARCEIHAKNMCAAEIHLELCAVYCQNGMSEETVTNGVECSKMGEQMFTMKTKWSLGHLQLVQSVDKKKS
jgi:hypothetical protein